MFIKNSKEEINNKTIVGESVSINGNFDCLEDVVIYGKIDGIIKTSKDVYIKKSSIINADIKANNVFVEGVVNGNVDCLGSIEIYSSAKVKGNVSTGVINIEKGALFNGKCSIKEDKNSKELDEDLKKDEYIALTTDIKKDDLTIKEVKQSRKKKKD